MASRYQLIASALSALPADRQLTIKGNLAWIRCPFHKGGNEATPSMTVALGHPRREDGHVKCFACGYSSKWEGFAKDLKLGSLDDVDEGALRIKGKHQIHEDDFENDWQKEVYSNLLDDPAAIEIDFKWRRIQPWALKAVRAKLRFFKVYNDLAVFLPVFINGQYIGAIHAEVEKTRKHSYMESPGGWKVKALYPFDLVVRILDKLKLKTVVLVEGPRDALFLCQNKVPALSILGTSGWTQQKQLLLEALGVENVIVMMDGDEAGRKAQKAIKKEIKAAKFAKCYSIALTEEKDPASLTRAEIERVKLFLKKVEGGKYEKG